MRFVDFFSGVGGFHSGLEKAGMTCVGWCEADKYAQKAYRELYDVEGLWFCDDIRNAKGSNIPSAEVWAFGFPCQDISIAGKGRGMGEGTRSGLFFEVMRLIDEREEDDKPRYLIVENVKNLLSIEGGQAFLSILLEMDKRGYDAEWKVYNSKNYGVPQNRERVYIAGCLRGKGRRKILPITRANDTRLIQEVGGTQGERVYNPTGTSCTLSANGGGMGAKTGLYRINVVAEVPSEHQRGRIYGTDGYIGTLTATDYKTPPKVLIKNNTKQGYFMATVGDGIDLAYAQQNKRRGRVQEGATQTITCGARIGTLTQDCRIRRLTPRECWRLQGFADEQFDKVKDLLSDTQLYKLAGNAVTVNVVYEIGLSLMKYTNMEE